MIVLVTMAMIMRMAAASEMKMGMRASGQLPKNIKEPEGDEGPAGDPGKKRADAIAQGDPEPGHDQAESSGESSVASGGEGRDEQGLWSVPALHPRGEDERQPVRRNGGVKECDREACERDRGENGIGHRSR